MCKRKPAREPSTPHIQWKKASSSTEEPTRVHKSVGNAHCHIQNLEICGTSTSPFLWRGNNQECLVMRTYIVRVVSHVEVIRSSSVRLISKGHWPKIFVFQLIIALHRWSLVLFRQMLYISPIYRRYRRDKGEGDIFYGIYRNISDILNVSRHIAKIARDDGKYQPADQKRWNSIL